MPVFPWNIEEIENHQQRQFCRYIGDKFAGCFTGHSVDNLPRVFPRPGLIGCHSGGCKVIANQFSIVDIVRRIQIDEHLTLDVIDHCLIELHRDRGAQPRREQIVVLGHKIDR